MVMRVSCCVLAFAFSAAVIFAEGEEAFRLNNEGVESLGRGELQDAVAKLEAARRVDPRNATVASNLASAYLRQGEDALRKGELKDAAHWCDRVMGLAGKNDALMHNLAASYNDIAAAHSKAGGYGEAVSLLETAVSLRPGNMVLKNNLGIALYRDNRRAE
ncbi:MAG: tetratricopeptide repeat protein, partial [Candidatus Aureabacteria bacterium]|nr:tetratricopeptide repeat protein [Candidatus Auribacterota bacterium]